MEYRHAPHVRLFIPGPVEMHPEILHEMAHPMISHRGADIQALISALVRDLKWLFATKDDVLLSTSSATGVWEAAARNCVKKRCLHLVNGAFSERWYESTTLNNREADAYEVAWGKAHRADEVRRRLETGRYDSIAVVHSETSTGVLDPLEEIADVVTRFPDVLLFVDVVSSLATMPIDTDALGIDLNLVGIQKGVGVPPGLSAFTVSKRAYERSLTIKDRGYYFHFEVLKAHAAKNETPATPAISQMYALRRQLERIREEGLVARFARHRRMAERCRGWAKDHGFPLFTEPGYEAPGITCVDNLKAKVDLPKLVAGLAARRFKISDGYGPLRGKTFRIAHMGDVMPEHLDELLATIDELLAA